MAPRILLFVCILVVLLQDKVAVSDVRLELTTPITTIEPVVAYNNSYVRSGSILTAPTDTTINHFVVACVAVGSNQSDIGQWYYPDGSLVGTALPPSALAGVTQERRLGKVLLYRDGCLECSSQVGVYRCIIPDLTGVEQSLYVGLYTASDPSRPISSEANKGPVLVGGACEYLLTTLPHVDPPVFQLNCTTMNSPATRANWTLNGSPAPSSNAASFQTVTNFAGAIYSNVLVVIGRIAGSYVCNVTTRRMEVPNNSENIGNDTLIGAPAIGNVTVEDSPGPLTISNIFQLNTTLMVSWTPPALGAAVRSYWVYVDGLMRSIPANTNSVTLQLSAGRTYTVQVVALGRHLPSLPSITVVELVTPPTVSIAQSQPYANAGTPFTLTCRVQFPSVPSSRVNIWWANATNFVLNSTVVQDSSTSHTLDFTFSPLKASEGGVYKCGIAVARYMTSVNATVVVKVPAPLVMANASSTFLIVGEKLQLNCTSQLLSYFNVPSMVTMTWTSPNDDELSTVMVQSTSGGIFMNNVPGSPVQLSSAGTYSCRTSLTFDPSPFLNLSSNTVFDQVTVVITSGPLSLSIKVPDTPAQFGMPYNLLCTVAVPMSSAPFDLNIRWKSGNTVMRNVTISNATYGMHESMLPFDSLNSSHMGMYWCEAGLGPLFSVAAQNVSVAVPPPTVSVVSSSGLYIVAGNTLNLACVIELDAFKYIDTVMVLNVTWMYPGEREKKSQIIPPLAKPLSLTSMLQLQSGSLGDAGNYSCKATLEPQQDTPFLTSSIPIKDMVQINVLERNMTLSILGDSLELGSPYVLTCQVYVPVVSTTLLLLQLELNFSTDTSNRSLKNMTIADAGNATHQLQIVLPSLSSADAGIYACHASFGPFKVMGTKVLDVQVPPPTLTVSAEPLNFIVVQESLMLLCSGVLSSAINTNVSITVSWSDPLGQVLKQEQMLWPPSNQRFGSQLYVPSVPFSGAGNYTCLVTITPQSSAMYVHGTHMAGQVSVAIMNGNMTVAISDDGTSASLGSPYNLSCNVNVPALSMRGQTLKMEWIFFLDRLNYSLSSTVIADPGNATHHLQISLPSLSTARAGTYACVGSVGPYEVKGTRVISLQVPPPTLVVSAQPTGFIVVQQGLTLLCSISLSSSIQTNTVVNVSWVNPLGQTLKYELMSGNSGIDSQLYLPSATFSDGGNYTCVVSVAPQPASIYLSGTVTSRQVEVAIMNGNMAVDISDDSTPASLGSPYNLSCNVKVPALSMRGQTLRIEFLDTSNRSLSNTVIADPGNATHQFRISIKSLSTADVGRYVCVAALGPYTGKATKENFLQVASPDLAISASPKDIVAAGTNVSLNCCAETSTMAQADFTASFTWMGPDGSVLSHQNLPVITTSSVCSTLSLRIQSSGVYTCSASVYSSTPSVFIVGSAPTVRAMNITVFTEIQQFSGCQSPRGSSAKALCMLTGTPSEIAAGVLSITNDASTLDSQSVAIVVRILSQLVQSSAKDNREVQNNFVLILSNLLTVDKAILYNSTTNPLLVKTVEIFTNVLGLGENESIRSFTQSKFVLQAQNLNATQPQSFVVPDKSRFETNKASAKLVAQYATIQLPSTLFDELNTSEIPGTVRAASSIFLDDLLFQPQQNISRRFSNYSLGSLVVSASLNIPYPVQNLKHPVQILLKIGPDAIQNGSNITCVFWDTIANGGSGDWSTEGCHLASFSNGTAMCECNHLTSFAILFDVSPKAKSDALIGLGVQIITFVGLAISIICLLVIVTTYIISSKLRTSILGKMLLNLCGSLMALFMVFIASSLAPPVPALCSFLSAMLHYTLLVYFFWTAAEAIHLYLKLVQVFETRWLHRHYVAIAMAICWGAPLIIVSISLSGYKDYGNSQFCRPYNLPFYIGFVLPFGIIYIFNWVMFVVTFVSIVHHVTRNDTTAYETFKKQFKIAVTISLLLGLGWAFGFLGTSALPKEIYIPAQYFFSFFMSFQGVLFLFFHGIKSTEVRQEWVRLFYVATGRSDKYRLYLHSSKMKSSDNTQKSTVSTTKMKSKAYSVDESHCSTDMELKVDLEKISREDQNASVVPQNVTEHSYDAWNEDKRKEKSPSNDEQLTPSQGPEHTCIEIPSENNVIEESSDGRITFNVLYVPVKNENDEQKSDINSAATDDEYVPVKNENEQKSDSAATDDKNITVKNENEQKSDINSAVTDDNVMQVCAGVANSSTPDNISDHKDSAIGNSGNMLDNDCNVSSNIK